MKYVGKLKDQIAVVAGATRGAGRGIACMLGEAGATVYCTGRSIRGNLSVINRPETIDMYSGDIIEREQRFSGAQAMLIACFLRFARYETGFCAARDSVLRAPLEKECSNPSTFPLP